MSKLKTKYCSADRPISKSKQDRLGRGEFAKTLGRDIHDWHGDDCLTIGLYGPWGSGKTSFKNLILNQLRHKRYSKRNPVLELNAWQFSGLQNIQAVFFQELGLKLSVDNPSKAHAKTLSRLKAYTSRLSMVSMVSRAVGYGLTPFVGPGALAVGEATAQGLAKVGDATNAGAELAKAEAESATKDMASIKKDFAKAMAKLEMPIVVVFDDIDRLSHHEILELMQLVKANADFPNLVFILLCERKIVEEALNSISGNRGRQFLEKIVQVGFDLPMPHQDAIEDILFQEIEEILQRNNALSKFDTARWSKVYRNGLDGYFSNLRQVYRFLNSFDFYCRHFGSGEGFEVNPIDLLVLETLRLFEPDVYHRLSDHSAVLTGFKEVRVLGEASITDEEVQMVIEDLTSLTEDRLRKRLTAILAELFPSISSYRKIQTRTNAWSIAARVCHPDLFAKYFRLSLAKEEVSQVEVERLYGVLGNETELLKQFTSLEKRGLHEKAIRKLEAYSEQIPIDQMAVMVKVFCDLSDQRAIPKGSILSDFDLVTRFWRISIFRLRRELDEDRRFQILKFAITNSTNLTLPFEFVSLDERVGDRYDFLMSEAQLAEMKTVCISRIRQFASDGKLRSHPRLLSILWRWSEWTNTDEVKEWIDGQLNTKSDAAWYLLLALRKVHAMQSGKTHFEVDWPQIERFVDLTRIRELLDSDQCHLNAEESDAVRVFDEAYLKTGEEKEK